MTDAIIYRLLKLFVRLLGFLPPGVADYCAGFMGGLWFKLDKRHRRVAMENLTHAFSGEMSSGHVESLAKQVFKNLVSILFEVAWSLRLDRKEFVSNHLTIKGIEHVEAAHAKGRGVIAISCHMGNFELLVSAIENTGFKGYGIYRKLDFAPLERLMRDLRQRYDAVMIPMRGVSKRVDAILRQGDVVGSLLDQNVDWYKGVFVDFFGRPACTNNGLAALAMRTKASVIPLYTVRKGRKYLIEFLPEIPLENTGDRIRDIERNTQNYTAAFESMIRRYPDQYFWVHNRWKTKNFCPWPKEK